MPKRKSDDEENGNKASKKLKTVKYGQIRPHKFKL